MPHYAYFHYTIRYIVKPAISTGNALLAPHSFSPYVSSCPPSLQITRLFCCIKTTIISGILLLSATYFLILIFFLLYLPCLPHQNNKQKIYYQKQWKYHKLEQLSHPSLEALDRTPPSLPLLPPMSPCYHNLHYLIDSKIFELNPAVPHECES